MANGVDSPRFISLEDHFVSQACQQYDVAKTLALHQFPKSTLGKLGEIGPQRIEAMDEGHVGLQVVSHIPVVIGLDECQAANDQLHEAVKRNPTRFAGFATLPVGDPGSIAGELERCVRQLGFVGALIPNHANGVYYDGSDYTAMWQMAERLDVPVYLHPCPPSPQALSLFPGNYSSDVAFALSTHAWDWHANCGLHFVRLYSAGVFERCPKLKVVLGHLGEMLPFMLGRTMKKLQLTKDAESWTESLQTVYRRNAWITTSGMFDIEPLKLVLNNTSSSRIMFSVDYPFESTVESAEFMATVKQAGLVSDDVFTDIAHRNAERLLRVNMK